MKKFLLAVMIFTTTGVVFAGDVTKETVNHLQTVSVTVETSRGSGSGIVKVRKFGDTNIAFVWTAAHVVDGLRHVKTVVDTKTGSPRLIVEFDDARVVKTLIEDGRTIGRVEVDAKVIRFNAEEDLAVLQVRQKNFSTDSVKFYLDAVAPGIGTKVVHVGSLLGEGGSNSMTTGIVSQQGRLIQSKVFDQITAPAFPGSSGGGVFLEDGRMIGQVLRGSGESFIFICPVRRTVEWAKEAKIGWAVDDTVAVPTLAELKKLPVEDNGVYSENASPAARTPHSHTFMYHKKGGFEGWIMLLP